MPIQAVLDETNFNSLEEPLKTLYVQNSENKQFYLDIPSEEAEKLAFNLQNRFENKKTELEKLHNERKAFEAELTAFKKLGKTPDEIKDFITKNRPEDVAKTLAEKEAEIQSIRDSYDSTVSEANTRAERYQQQLCSKAISSRVAQARNEFNLNDDADDILPNYYKAEEKDGEIVTRIYLNGEPAKVAGLDMTDAQLMKHFQDNKMRLGMFNAGNVDGSGMNGKQQAYNGNGKQMKRADFDKLDPVSAMNFIKGGGTPVD